MLEFRAKEAGERACSKNTLKELTADGIVAAPPMPWKPRRTARVRPSMNTL